MDPKKQKYKPFKPKFVKYPDKDHIPDIKVDEGTVNNLFAVVQDGNYNKIRNAIINNNTTFNVRNEDGDTLLHTVLSNEKMKPDDRIKLTSYLIQHGAPIDAFNKNNVTPLHLAAKYALHDAVDLLLNNGANSNVLDSQQMSALHYAVTGTITTCKSKKKITSLVPKEVQKPQTSKELRDVSKLLIDIIYTPNFSQYVKHIRDTIALVPQMYAEEIEEQMKNHIDRLNSIASGDESDNVKSQQIVKEISDYRNTVQKFIRDRVKAEDIKFTSRNPKGWGPTDDYNDHILDETYIDKFNKLDDSHHAYQKETFNQITEKMSEINKIIGENRASLAGIVQNITDIIYFNEYLKQNRIVYGIEVKPENEFNFTDQQLTNFMVHPDQTQFNFNELASQTNVQVPIDNSYMLGNINQPQSYNLLPKRIIEQQSKIRDSTMDEVILTNNNRHSFVGLNEQDALSNARRYYAKVYGSCKRAVLNHLAAADQPNEQFRGIARPNLIAAYEEGLNRNGNSGGVVPPPQNIPAGRPPQLANFNMAMNDAFGLGYTHRQNIINTRAAAIARNNMPNIDPRTHSPGLVRYITNLYNTTLVLGNSIVELQDAYNQGIALNYNYFPAGPNPPNRPQTLVDQVTRIYEQALFAQEHLNLFDYVAQNGIGGIPALQDRERPRSYDRNRNITLRNGLTYYDYGIAFDAGLHNTDWARIIPIDRRVLPQAARIQPTDLPSFNRNFRNAYLNGDEWKVYYNMGVAGNQLPNPIPNRPIGDPIRTPDQIIAIGQAYAIGVTANAERRRANTAPQEIEFLSDNDRLPENAIASMNEPDPPVLPPLPRIPQIDWANVPQYQPIYPPLETITGPPLLKILTDETHLAPDPQTTNFIHGITVTHTHSSQSATSNEARTNNTNLHQAIIRLMDHYPNIEDFINENMPQPNTGNTIKQVFDTFMTANLRFIGRLSLPANSSENYIGNNTSITNIITSGIVEAPRQQIQIANNTLQVNGGPFNNRRYYFFSKLKFYSDRLEKYANDILSDNIDFVKNNFEHDNFYDTFYRVMTNMLTGVLSMMIIINDIYKDYLVKNNLEDFLLKANEFSTGNSSSPGHPYHFSHVRIVDGIINVIKLLRTVVKNTTDTLFKALKDLADNMNKIITLLNNMSALKFIKAFHSQQFNALNVAQFNKFYEIPIRNLLSLPSSFAEFNKFVGEQDPKTVREKLIDEYFPLISDQYKLKYVRSTNPDGPPGATIIRNFNLIRTNPDINNVYNSVQNPVYAGLNLNSVNGYLFSGDVTGLTLREGLQIGNIGITDENLYNNRDKKKESTTSIMPYLQQHIEMIKLMLIQQIVVNFARPNSYINVAAPPNLPASLGNVAGNVGLGDSLSARITTIKNGLQKSFGELGILNANIPSLLFTTVGKIAQNLIQTWINYSIQRATILQMKKVAKKADIDPQKGDFSKVLKDDESAMAIFDVETNYRIALPKTFREITDIYKESVVDKSKFNRLKYSSIIMQPEEEVNLGKINQYELHDIDYFAISTDKQCQQIDLDIIDLLIKHGASPNSKNTLGSTPIFDCIDLQNTQACERLINSGAFVSHQGSGNSYGVTPIDHALQLFKNHIDETNILKVLVKKHNKNIIKKIQGNENYNNNLIKYLDLALPQFIVMYNEFLADKLQGYFKKWTTENQKNLDKTFEKYNINLLNDEHIPLLDQEMKYIMKKSSNAHVLMHELADNNKDRKNKREQINRLKEEIKGYQMEIQELEQEVQKNPSQIKSSKINHLKKQINQLRKDISTFTSNIMTFRISKTNLKSNIEVSYDDQFNKKRSAFLEHDKRFEADSPDKLYDSAFKYVVNNGNLSATAPYKYNGHEDHYLYNEMWKEYLKSDNIYNKNNIHLSLEKVEKQMLGEIEKRDYSSSEHLKHISDAYTNVLLHVIDDYYKMPDYYNMEENYMMYGSMNIAMHIAKHVLCSSFYFMVLKTITEYLMKVSPKTLDSLNKKNLQEMFEGTPGQSSSMVYSDYTSGVIDAFIRYDHISSPRPPGAPPAPLLPSQTQSTLVEYINNELPSKLVKHVFEVFEHDLDSDKKIADIKELLEKILPMIQNNEVLAIGDESPVIKTLQERIIPYYSEVMQVVLEQMKTLLDSYNRYIMVSGKHANIMHMLVEKAKTEKQ